MEFNKNIYQVWYQGYNNIENPNYIQNIDNWKILNPNWKYHFLDNDDLQSACQSYSEECLNAYNIAEVLHTKIDLGKLVMIYLNGGIMVDMDMYALRSLDSSKVITDIINTYESNGIPIIGLSLNNVNTIESYTINGTSITYNNAMVISSAKNPLLKVLIDHIINNINNYTGKEYTKTSYVQFTTGPRVFNQVIDKNKKISEIISFDYTLFEPCKPGTTLCDITDNTLAIHNYEMSWVNPSMKKLISLYYHQKFDLIILLGIFVGYIYYVNRNTYSIYLIVGYLLVVSYLIYIN